MPTRTYPGPARRPAWGLAVATAALVAGAGAEAQEMRLSLGLAESHAFYAPLTGFSQRLAEAGVANKLFSLQVLGVAEASSGVRDGIVDAAMVLFPYFANEYSEANLAAELSMIATSGTLATLPGAAMNGATMEYIMPNCAGCLAQFKAQNQVYVAGTSTTDYAMVCNKPIGTLADMAGKRIRTGAGNYTRMAEAVAATSVTMKGNEVYDALGHGVVDCTMQPVASILDFRYIEVANSVLLGFPGGVFSGVGIANFNRDSWNRLSADQRLAALKAGAALAAAGYYNNAAMDANSLKAARDKGMNVFSPDDELRARMTAFVESDLATIEAQLATKFGLKDVGAKIAKMRALIEKWKGLTNDPGMTEAKLADLYWTEIYAKLDAAGYGTD